MAGSMLTQMLVNGFVQKEDVMASAYHEKRRKQLRERYGIAVTDDNVEVAQDAVFFLLSQNLSNLHGENADDLFPVHTALPFRKISLSGYTINI